MNITPYVRNTERRHALSRKYVGCIENIFLLWNSSIVEGEADGKT